MPATCEFPGCTKKWGWDIDEPARRGEGTVKRFYCRDHYELVLENIESHKTGNVGRAARKRAQTSLFTTGGGLDDSFVGSTWKQKEQAADNEEPSS